MAAVRRVVISSRNETYHNTMSGSPVGGYQWPAESSTLPRDTITHSINYTGLHKRDPFGRFLRRPDGQTDCALSWFNVLEIVHNIK